MLKTIFYPILFYTNKSNFNFSTNLYKIKDTNKLINKYNFLKKLYFILYYSDLVLLDKKFLSDFRKDKKKVLKYLESTKKDFLFFYYNNKIYDYNRLIKLINSFSFNFNSFFYFLSLKNKNKKFLNIIFYLKKKKCLLKDKYKKKI